MQIPEFSLCAALVGHTGDVRSLAVGAGHLYSGARDKVVMAWSLDEVCKPRARARKFAKCGLVVSAKVHLRKCVLYAAGGVEGVKWGLCITSAPLENRKYLCCRTAVF